MTGEVNDVMLGSDGLRIWGDFWKKAVSWDPNLDESSWDCGVHARLLGQWVEIRRWMKRVDFLIWARLGQLGLRDAPRVVGSDGTVSVVEIVSLSPRVEKPKSQEGNKSFVSELLRVVSVSGFLCMWTFHVSVYFTCIRIMDMLHIYHLFVWSNFNFLHISQ